MGRKSLSVKKTTVLDEITSVRNTWNLASKSRFFQNYFSVNIFCVCKMIMLFTGNVQNHILLKHVMWYSRNMLIICYFWLLVVITFLIKENHANKWLVLYDCFYISWMFLSPLVTHVIFFLNTFFYVTVLCVLFYNKRIDSAVLCCAACQSVQPDSCQLLIHRVFGDSLVRKELCTCVWWVTLASCSSSTLHFFSLFLYEGMRVVPRMCQLK